MSKQIDPKTVLGLALKQSMMVRSNNFLHSVAKYESMAHTKEMQASGMKRMLGTDVVGWIKESRVETIASLESQARGLRKKAQIIYSEYKKYLIKQEELCKKLLA